MDEKQVNNGHLSSSPPQEAEEGVKQTTITDYVVQAGSF